MAKKQPRAPSTADRHKVKHMVRVENDLYDRLERLAARTRRSVTMEVRIAIEAHLAQAGLWQPPESLP